jgi:hypothetical protein
MKMSTDNNVNARLTALEQRLDAETAERLALQQLLLPSLHATREELALNVDYFTRRLEDVKSQPGMDADVAEAFADVYRCLIEQLKMQIAERERLDWLIGVVTRFMEHCRDTDKLLLERSPIGGLS